MEVKTKNLYIDDYINKIINYPTSRFSKYSRGIQLTNIFWSKMTKKIKKIINKKKKSKIICLTAYSKNIAEILDKYCDLILVGDSLGSVLYNYKSTKEVI